MTRHVTFLIRLTQLWSGFNLVVGLALAAFAVAAATLVVSAREQPPGTEVAAGRHRGDAGRGGPGRAGVGRRRITSPAAGSEPARPWARNLALMLAAFNLLLLPLGTALGLYTLWVLLHEHVRVEFHA